MKRIIGLAILGLGTSLASAISINYDFEGWKPESKLPSTGVQEIENSKISSDIIQKMEKRKISNLINSNLEKINQQDKFFLSTIKNNLSVYYYKFSPDKNLLFLQENMGNMVVGKNFVKLFGEANRLEKISNTGVILTQQLNDGKFFPIVDYQKNIVDPNSNGCYSKYDIAKTFINPNGNQTYSLEKNLLYSWSENCKGDKKSDAKKANIPNNLIEKITESDILPISNEQCKKVIFDERNGGNWICQN